MAVSASSSSLDAGAAARVLAEQRDRSHYHLADVAITDQACQGLACFVARHGGNVDWATIRSQEPRVYCLGKCYAAPAQGADQTRPRVAVDARASVVLHRLVDGGAQTLERYIARDGYAALAKWLRKSPAAALDEIERSGLRGRGGAGFPTATKWRAVAKEPARPKTVIVNADEGDPGAYIDRCLLEGDPHAIIEASALAGYAVGAEHGIVYLRKEYLDAARILATAIDEARGAGWLGSNVAGTGFAFDLEIVSGQGSYVCGEETALLNSIERVPPMVRPRPPYPTERGLFGRPTLVNNVETLANIPWILRHGGAAYHALGFSQSRGTKAVSLNSLFRRPGLYEVEFGVPLRHIIDDLGGGLQTGEIRGVIIGGPLAGIVPPALFDTPFGFEELQQVGASVGHGGIVAFDDRTSLPELLEHVFSFAAYESCGKCTPCRIGSRALEQSLRATLSGEPMSREERSFATKIVEALQDTSMCGLGTALAEFAQSARKYYSKEVAHAFGQD